MKKPISDDFNLDNEMKDSKPRHVRPRTARNMAPAVQEFAGMELQAKPMSGPKYTIAQMEEVKSEYEQKIEASKGITKKMPVTGLEIQFFVDEVDPALVDIVDENGRIQKYLDVVSLSDILPAIKQDGQQQPGMLRPAECGRYELIYGSRRLACCHHLGIKYQALIGKVPDKDIQLLTDSENQYKELSFYEKAMSYDRRVKSGEFKSWRHLGSSLEIPPATLDRYKKACDLPDVFLRVLPSLSDMPTTYPTLISKLMDGNADEVLQAANRIASLREEAVSQEGVFEYSAEMVLKDLKAASRVAPKGAVKPTPKKPVFYSSADTPARVKRTLSSSGTTKLEFIDFDEEHIDKAIEEFLSGLKLKA